jgi:hypothetical protein
VLNVALSKRISFANRYRSRSALLCLLASLKSLVIVDPKLDTAPRTINPKANRPGAVSRLSGEFWTSSPNLKKRESRAIVAVVTNPAYCNIVTSKVTYPLHVPRGHVPRAKQGGDERRAPASTIATPNTVSTVGRDEGTIRAYIKNQEIADQQLDQLQLKLGSP